jgi:hypothetical protein
MDPTTFRLISASAGAGVALPDIGTSMEGGYFAGAISSSANGVATHGLIVSPKASGSNGGTPLEWAGSTYIQGTTSEYDGAANTAAILTWLSGDPGREAPAGAYCAGLSIGGYSDWYLPARFELEIAYFNLKPSTNSNHTGSGSNSYAVPQRTANYTSSDPARTSVSAFQSSGSEHFRYTGSGYAHWSSTQWTSNLAYMNLFEDGSLTGGGKAAGRYVRAFRKYAL